jgi:hypothetical protein
MKKPPTDIGVWMTAHLQDWEARLDVLVFDNTLRDISSAPRDNAGGAT